MKINYWQKFEEDNFYHIYNRGINSENIFLSDNNYTFFLKKWKELLHNYVKMGAYCLMPNHFHFLVQIRPATEKVKGYIKKEKTSKSIQFLRGDINYNDFLEDQFKRLFSSYVLAFNKQQNRKGSLFQKRFKRVTIKDDLKLLSMLAYIHYNPIQHKFSNDLLDWKYCSYKAYLSEKPTNVIKNQMFKYFDGNDVKKAKELFVEYHKEYVY